MKSDWATAIYQLQQQGDAYVIVTVIGVTGSTPRASGTKMVIARQKNFDTIGGGHLEHKAIAFANKLLSENIDCQQLEHFELGVHLDQCCGGSANLLFECFSSNRINIMLFGAGHVGQLLLPILATLPCKITWVDSRESWLTENVTKFSNVKKVISSSPHQQVSNMPEGSYFVIMTHKHQMDFDICHQIIKREDYQYLGLIGSKTKWHRFKQRLLLKNISEHQLNRVNCPVGLSSVTGKKPAEVAVSIAAEIINHYQQKQPQFNQQGVHWNNLKNLKNISAVSSEGEH